ncbi:hypothetical protein [Arenibaculum pallidiluteum]|uniref:hypothetical protein n=1 Tax=Arenibaculum pallidiluteum TaxID=2812559 RepID=UPI001A95F559|nr:hypothetical protein [Arenibaculum pallidiluteum]
MGTLKLGTRVRVGGRMGMIVARTLDADSYYDVRFEDGSVTKYLRGHDLDPILADAAGGEGEDAER